MSPKLVDPKAHTFHSPRFTSVVEEAIGFFDATPVHELPPAGRFAGVGVYALYYTGEFEEYRYIAAQNRDACVQPIYVGKAVPPGWRAARATADPEARSLYGRLREHARSISQAAGLKLPGFRTRFVILRGLETDLVVPIEAELIRRHTPLWNTAVDGFGNHDPGKGRYNQARSEWDVLHPGRAWADRLTGPSPILEEILAKIRANAR